MISTIQRIWVLKIILSIGHGPVRVLAVPADYTNNMFLQSQPTTLEINENKADHANVVKEKYYINNNNHQIKGNVFRTNENNIKTYENVAGDCGDFKLHTLFNNIDSNLNTNTNSFIPIKKVNPFCTHQPDSWNNNLFDKDVNEEPIIIADSYYFDGNDKVVHYAGTGKDILDFKEKIERHGKGYEVVVYFYLFRDLKYNYLGRSFTDSSILRNCLSSFPSLWCVGVVKNDWCLANINNNDNNIDSDNNFGVPKVQTLDIVSKLSDDSNNRLTIEDNLSNDSDVKSNNIDICQEGIEVKNTNMGRNSNNNILIQGFESNKNNYVPANCNCKIYPGIILPNQKEMQGNTITVGVYPKDEALKTENINANTGFYDNAKVDYNLVDLATDNTAKTINNKESQYVKQITDYQPLQPSNNYIGTFPYHAHIRDYNAHLDKLTMPINKRGDVMIKANDYKFIDNKDNAVIRGNMLTESKAMAMIQNEQIMEDIKEKGLYPINIQNDVSTTVPINTLTINPEASKPLSSQYLIKDDISSQVINFGSDVNSPHNIRTVDDTMELDQNKYQQSKLSGSYIHDLPNKKEMEGNTIIAGAYPNEVALETENINANTDVNSKTKIDYNVIDLATNKAENVDDEELFYTTQSPNNFKPLISATNCKAALPYGAHNLPKNEDYSAHKLNYYLPTIETIQNTGFLSRDNYENHFNISNTNFEPKPTSKILISKLLTPKNPADVISIPFSTKIITPTVKDRSDVCKSIANIIPIRNGNYYSAGGNINNALPYQVILNDNIRNNVYNNDNLSVKDKKIPTSYLDVATVSNNKIKFPENYLFGNEIRSPNIPLAQNTVMFQPNSYPMSPSVPFQSYFDPIRTVQSVKSSFHEIPSTQRHLGISSVIEPGGLSPNKASALIYSPNIELTRLNPSHPIPNVMYKTTTDNNVPCVYSTYDANMIPITGQQTTYLNKPISYTSEYLSESKSPISSLSQGSYSYLSPQRVTQTGLDNHPLYWDIDNNKNSKAILGPCKGTQILAPFASQASHFTESMHQYTPLSRPLPWNKIKWNPIAQNTVMFQPNSYPMSPSVPCQSYFDPIPTVQSVKSSFHEIPSTQRHLGISSVIEAGGLSPNKASALIYSPNIELTRLNPSHPIPNVMYKTTTDNNIPCVYSTYDANMIPITGQQTTYLNKPISYISEYLPNSKSPIPSLSQGSFSNLSPQRVTQTGLDNHPLYWDIDNNKNSKAILGPCKGTQILAPFASQTSHFTESMHQYTPLSRPLPWNKIKWNPIAQNTVMFQPNSYPMSPSVPCQSYFDPIPTVQSVKSSFHEIPSTQRHLGISSVIEAGGLSPNKASALIYSPNIELTRLNPSHPIPNVMYKTTTDNNIPCVYSTYDANMIPITGQQTTYLNKPISYTSEYLPNSKSPIPSLSQGSFSNLSPQRVTQTGLDNHPLYWDIDNNKNSKAILGPCKGTQILAPFASQTSHFTESMHQYTPLSRPLPWNKIKWNPIAQNTVMFQPNSYPMSPSVPCQSYFDPIPTVQSVKSSFHEIPSTQRHLGISSVIEAGGLSPNKASALIYSPNIELTRLNPSHPIPNVMYKTTTDNNVPCVYSTYDANMIPITGQQTTYLNKPISYTSEYLPNSKSPIPSLSQGSFSNLSPQRVTQTGLDNHPLYWDIDNNKNSKAILGPCKGTQILGRFASQASHFTESMHQYTPLSRPLSWNKIKWNPIAQNTVMFQPNSYPMSPSVPCQSYFDPIPTVQSVKSSFHEIPSTQRHLGISSVIEAGGLSPNKASALIYSPNIELTRLNPSHPIPNVMYKTTTDNNVPCVYSTYDTNVIPITGQQTRYLNKPMSYTSEYLPNSKSPIPSLSQGSFSNLSPQRVTQTGLDNHPLYWDIDNNKNSKAILGPCKGTQILGPFASQASHFTESMHQYTPLSRPLSWNKIKWNPIAQNTVMFQPNSYPMSPSVPCQSYFDPIPTVQSVKSSFHEIPSTQRHLGISSVIEPGGLSPNKASALIYSPNIELTRLNPSHPIPNVMYKTTTDNNVPCVYSTYDANMIPITGQQNTYLNKPISYTSEYLSESKSPISSLSQGSYSNLSPQRVTQTGLDNHPLYWDIDNNKNSKAILGPCKGTQILAPFASQTSHFTESMHQYTPLSRPLPWNKIKWNPIAQNTVMFQPNSYPMSPSVPCQSYFDPIPTVQSVKSSFHEIPSTQRHLGISSVIEAGGLSPNKASALIYSPNIELTRLNPSHPIPNVMYKTTTDNNVPCVYSTYDANMIPITGQQTTYLNKPISYTSEYLSESKSPISSLSQGSYSNLSPQKVTQTGLDNHPLYWDIDNNKNSKAILGSCKGTQILAPFASQASHFTESMHQYTPLSRPLPWNKIKWNPIAQNTVMFQPNSYPMSPSVPCQSYFDPIPTVQSVKSSFHEISSTQRLLDSVLLSRSSLNPYSTPYTHNSLLPHSSLLPHGHSFDSFLKPSQSILPPYVKTGAYILTAPIFSSEVKTPMFSVKQLNSQKATFENQYQGQLPYKSSIGILSYPLHMAQSNPTSGLFKSSQLNLNAGTPSLWSPTVSIITKPYTKSQSSSFFTSILGNTSGQTTNFYKPDINIPNTESYKLTKTDTPQTSPYLQYLFNSYLNSDTQSITPATFNMFENINYKTVAAPNTVVAKYEPFINDYFTIQTDDNNIELKAWRSKLKIIKPIIIYKVYEVSTLNFIPIVKKSGYSAEQAESIAKSFVIEKYGDPIVMNGVYSYWQPYAIINNFNVNKIKNNIVTLIWPTLCNCGCYKSGCQCLRNK